MKEKDYSKKIVTIPNLLSMFRFVLAFVFLICYMQADSERDYLLSLGLLALSALTDVVDGRIARHFHMVSDLGKILDPVADKVTQGFVMLALVSRYPLMAAEIVIFLLKEAYMALMGLKVMRTTGWNEGAQWYGKLNTVVLYGVSVVLILFFEIPLAAANILIAGCCISIVFCLYKYHMEFKQILGEHQRQKTIGGNGRESEKGDSNEKQS